MMHSVFFGCGLTLQSYHRELCNLRVCSLWQFGALLVGCGLFCRKYTLITLKHWDTHTHTEYWAHPPSGGRFLPVRRVILTFRSTFGGSSPAVSWAPSDGQSWGTPSGRHRRLANYDDHQRWCRPRKTPDSATASPLGSLLGRGDDQN